MSRFTIKDLPLEGPKLVTRHNFGDSRGFLSRLFCVDDLRQAGWTKAVAQINHTYTAERGTVRGLHYQRPPHAEMKYVSCIRGEIWDVLVDVRVGSPGFLRWHAERLSANRGSGLLVPEGFAHGFQALTDDVELIYCHSAIYVSEAEGGLHPEDPRLAIAWPLPIRELSQRDASHPMLAESFDGIAT